MLKIVENVITLTAAKKKSPTETKEVKADDLVIWSGMVRKHFWAFKFYNEPNQLHFHRVRAIILQLITEFTPFPRKLSMVAPLFEADNRFHLYVRKQSNTDRSDRNQTNHSFYYVKIDLTTNF